MFCETRPFNYAFDVIGQLLVAQQGLLVVIVSRRGMMSDVNVSVSLRDSNSGGISCALG
jgi:hypothetical protein